MHSLQQIKRLNSLPNLAVLNQTVTVNNKEYRVKCDFHNGTIKCKKNHKLIFESTTDDYVQSDGNLTDYIRSKVGPISNRPKGDLYQSTLTRKQKIAKITQESSPQTQAIAWAMEESLSDCLNQASKEEL